MRISEITVVQGKLNRDKLDRILKHLCRLVIAGQKTDPNFYGRVAAAVIDPQGQTVLGLNYLYGVYRVHAERAAIDRYEQQFGELPPGSTVVTTLSPCSGYSGDIRQGESCTELLNDKRVKITYCGYKDHTQEDHNDFTVYLTKNPSIHKQCENFAESFLNENFADGRVKGKSRPGRVKRAGASCAGSVTDLRARAKKYGGEKGKMYQWCLNMKAGKKK